MTYADVLVPIPREGSFTYSIPEDLSVQAGMRVIVPFGGQTLCGAVIRTHETKPEGFTVKPVSSVIDDEPVFDDRLIELSRSLSDVYVCSHGEAIHCALPGRVNGKSRFKKGFDSASHTFELSREQEKVYRDILDSPVLVHLLHGITGSGKTEVYMKLALDTLNAGKSVIFMVPEITLSSQLYRRLDSVFGELLTVYHSRLSANQKVDHWKAFYSGQARIVIGTRSAVFMQSPDTGLIIIDEEHDPSYKENKTPRYNTRRLALIRSQKEGCRVVMGSATPSIESYHAAREGQIGFQVLNERYNNAAIPDIELIPLSEDDTVLSPRLRSETIDAVKRGEQAVLMINRRGYAPLRMCSACKTRIQCPDCNVPLTYHVDGFLKCHYCGYIIPDVSTCPQCGSPDMLMIGSGTQRIEDDLEELFPAFSVFRLDRDSARKKNTIDEMIAQLDAGTVDIVIGTQMIAKGFDFHGITLVGVLMADIGMSLPDFRSGERIFSLLMQVAGRCGRGEKRGKVLIQTLDPDNLLFGFLKNHDYPGFYELECELRRAMFYPPFSRIVRIVSRGKNEADVLKVIEKIGNYVQRELKDRVIQILGPAPAPFGKIASNYRYHIIIKHGITISIRNHLRKIQKLFKQRDIYIEIDVDPVDML